MRNDAHHSSTKLTSVNAAKPSSVRTLAPRSTSESGRHVGWPLHGGGTSSKR